jgi:hypothetical protein
LRQKPTCNLVEIDVSKAYTSALIKIDNIPIFNEFDIFQPYNGEIIKDLSLYIVEVKENDLFLNKSKEFMLWIFIDSDI